MLPPDNFLGPSMGKMTVYDNLKKLQYDLFRAEEKAKHVEAVKADMDRKHRIYVDNVMRVKGAVPIMLSIQRSQIHLVCAVSGLHLAFTAV